MQGMQSWCCAEAGRGRVNPAQHSEGKEGPFPFLCPHPAAGSCLGCTCLASVAVGVAAALF